MMAKKQSTDVTALAEALKRLLEKRDGAYGLSDGGYFSGHVQDVFFKLVDDWTYYSIADRPHDSAALRASLKKHANELHLDHGVVVTLKDRGCVMLGTAGVKKK